MAQNTVVWLLSKGLNDIATSGETPKFDIKWSLPIYDHLTDGTVMTTPYANPGPDMDDGTTPPTHNQQDPGDFNGLFYTNGLKYSLSQWETDGTAGVTETTGWAKNPEWSLSVMERDTSRPAEANTGSNTTFLYGSVSGGTFSGDDYGTNHLSSWSVSNLYENVRYDGTSTEDTDPGEDPRAYAHYTVYLRCEKSEPGIDPTPGFIVGSVRFNKVLLFTDIDGSPSPIAMVCLGTPVALFSDNQGQSNSLAISFQLGFNPNDTAVENVSFDNLYWTKVGEYPDHEGDMRLYSRNRIVLGDEIATDNGAAIQIRDTLCSFKPFSYIGKSSTTNEVVYAGFGRPSLNIFDINTTDSSFNPETVVSGNFGINIYAGSIDSQTFQILNNSSFLSVINTNEIRVNTSFAAYQGPSKDLLDISTSFLAENGNSASSIFAEESLVAAAGCKKESYTMSVIATAGLDSLVNKSEYATQKYHRKLEDALLIGGGINVAYPVGTDASGDFELYPELTVAVGNNNKIYAGEAFSSENDFSSRTVIFGRNNQVDNSWCNPGTPVPRINGEIEDSYVLGSCNTIGYGLTPYTNLFHDSQTKNYVLGNMNVIGQAYNINLQSRIPTNKYILGSGNIIGLDNTAGKFPDIYVFGSNNKVTISSESNKDARNKYVFGSGMTIGDYEEFVVGHYSVGWGHDVPHWFGEEARMFTLGINGAALLNVRFGDENISIPTKTTIMNSSVGTYPYGTLCYEPDASGFHQLFYYYPGLIPNP